MPVPAPRNITKTPVQLSRILDLTAWCGIPAPIRRSTEAPQQLRQATRLAPLVQCRSYTQVSDV